MSASAAPGFLTRRSLPDAAQAAAAVLAQSGLARARLRLRSAMCLPKRGNGRPVDESGKQDWGVTNPVVIERVSTEYLGAQHNLAGGSR